MSIPEKKRSSLTGRQKARVKEARSPEGLPAIAGETGNASGCKVSGMLPMVPVQMHEIK